jgi:hypothetical protein
MALQIRRGTNNQRISMPLALAQGELAFVTDSASQHVSPVWVGDGSTIGGIPVAPVVSVNGKTGQAVLTADDLATGITNKYFTNALSHASTASLLTTATLTGLTITYNSGTDALTITNTNIINSATSANTLSYYAATGKTLSPTQSLTWNESLNILQVVNGSIQSTSNIIGGSLIIADAYGAGTNRNSIEIRRARGTNITPAAVVAGDPVGSYNFKIWDGTSWIIAGSIDAYTATTTAISTGVNQGLMNFSVPDVTGAISTRLRITDTGIIVGPAVTTDTGTGQLTVRQTISSSSTSTVYIRNYFNDANPSSIALRKYRGTYAANTAVVNNDVIGEINSGGYDGTGGQIVGKIQFVVNGAVSTGIVPGSIVLSTANSSGTLTQALKIDRNQQSTYSGDVVVNGNLTVNGATTTINSSTISIDDKNIELASVTSGVISTTGTVGSITGVSSPWTATITGMSTTTGLIVGSAITATNGSPGSLGGSGTYIVASIVSATSITYTATGGTIPVAGTITNITTTGATDLTANGAGVTVIGTTNKTFAWSNASSAWTSSENIVLANGKTLTVNGDTTIGGDLVGIATQNVFNTISTTLNIGSAATTLTLGNTTAASTYNFASGATLTATTKTINIGTSGVSGSTTNITLGSNNSVSGALGTITHYGNTVLSSGSLTFSGDMSRTAWTTSGIRHVSVPAVLTDTTSTGTVANAYTNNFGGNTIAASNAVTFTNYATVFLNDPTAGTNVTITNAYSLITAGNVKLGSTGTGTITATAATATTASTASSLGYIGMPQQSKSSAYTTVIGDQGKHIYVTATATITIDSNANVPYPIGTTIAFIAASGATVTIAITTDTMYLGGTGTTGSRTLAPYGMATAVKVTATSWFINGTGLT